MDNVLISLIEKLPIVYLMVLLPILLVSAIWLFTHIRRDKQGKIYFYSQKYEDRKRNRKFDAMMRAIEENKATLKENIESDRETRKDLLQLQICAVELPETAKRIAYREYKRLGFNSWVDDYVVEKGLFAKKDVDYIHNNPELPK